MNIQTRSSILVLGIFIFGIICGFFLHTVLIENRFPPPPHANDHFDFSKRLEDVLHITSVQRKEIEPILKKYDEKFHQTIDNARLKGMAIMDSMKVELTPYLSDKQKEILNHEINHFKTPPPSPPPGPMRR